MRNINAIFFILLIMISSGYSQISKQIELKSDWYFKEKNRTNEWYKATVPGCIHSDLLSNKVITDPYYRINEKDVQWIDKKDWIYKTEFTVQDYILSRQNIYLTFKGLDTYARVYLNDILIIEANNMFREWSIECKNILKKDGVNTLVVEFESPINKTIPLYDTLSFHYPAPNDQSVLGGIGEKKVSVFSRKAAYQFGWDWGPRLITSGIWRPIMIEAYDNMRITDLSFSTKSIKGDTATLSALVQVQTNQTIEASVDFYIQNTKIASTKQIFEKGISTKFCNLLIKSPKLWWCNGLGEPNLYNIKCVVSKGDLILDEKTQRMGIRTIELVHKPDSIGKSFYFKLNGIPVFMKGANYIPLDNFPSRVTKERYTSAIQSAVDANMNMLRVWGGGIYEDDIFYNLCDEKGILLWQDFMFACSLYPGDGEFVESVKHEVSDNVKRLRNHPSIALWCGNNEINTAWNDWGWKSTFEKESPELAKKLWNDYKTLFQHVIPDELHKNDSSLSYWSSSPMASIDQKAGSCSSGDMHFWDVWHLGKPFEEYNKTVGRFMSEYGFQSFPDINTVDTYTTPKDWNIESEVMTAHQRHPKGNELIKTYLDYSYKKPKDFQNFLYVGQVLQAEGIKMAIEAHRRAKPRCMGTLYWQLNDCWPVASWSSTDYYGRWKALHYFVKKAYSPILISQTITDTKANVTIVSDLLTNKSLQIECKIIDFDGTILWKQNKNIMIAANATANFTFDIGSVINLDSIKAKTMLIVSALDDKSIYPSIAYFKAIKVLALPNPTITKTLVAKDGGYTITIQTDKLAKNIYLQTDKKGFFSDNYFDLLPGEIKIIEFKTQSKSFDITNLKISSLVDTY